MGGKNGVSFLFGTGRGGAPCEECGGQGCSAKRGRGGCWEVRAHRPTLLFLFVCWCMH